MTRIFISSESPILTKCHLNEGCCFKLCVNLSITYFLMNYHMAAELS